MHRIDTKTAQKDKFGAGKNGFTRGNPQTGTPATDLDDDYFDMLQEELCSVVEASGASLEKGRHDQLLTALRALLLSRNNPFGDIKSDGTVKTALENLGLGDDARLSGNLTVKGGVWDTAPGNTPERVWSPNNKPSLTTLGVLDATTTQKGIVELATNAEMATGTSSSLVPSVAAVMSLFSKRSFAANDYVRIPDVPGGLIIQWVSGNASASGAFFAQMPIPFPNKLLFAGAVEAGANVWGTNSATTWGIDFANSSLSQVIAYARRIFPTTVTQESAAGLVIAIGN
ncbi:putative phage tail protein [Escherichia coli]|nr:putative phage tail protein [Escherichia coli]